MSVALVGMNFNGKYIQNIKRCVIYSEIKFEHDEAVWDVLNDIHEFCGKEKFIFALDEWDYIFHRDYIKDEDKQDYLEFLRNLLKDKPYISLAYMTGILPITLESGDSIVDASGESLQAVFPADASYSSGSELNMFLEYAMATGIPVSTKVREYAATSMDLQTRDEIFEIFCCQIQILWKGI